MSDIINDSMEMQNKYGMLSETPTHDKLRFRILGLQNEENLELNEALHAEDPEEIVDALIDTIVVALGTLQIFGVDAQKAWDEVYRANMSKVRGVKPGREQSGGFDLIKPDGWTAPDHSDNHGVLDQLFEEERNRATVDAE